MTGAGNDHKTSSHVDELLRARSRNRPRPLPVPPVPPTNDVSSTRASRSTAVEEHVGYPVPPRRRPRPVSTQPSARQLARRDWFIAGLVLGAFGGAALTMVFVFVVLAIG